ncbi:hypothetical protein ACQPZJ_12990 [Actinoplanes sp. CA-054009]
MIPLEVIQAVATRRKAPLKELAASRLVDAQEIAVLRVGAAEDVDEPDRASIGFGAGQTEAVLLEALRGWWRCDPDRVIASRIAPVTLGGFVVAVLTGLQQGESESPLRSADGVIRHRFQARLGGYITDLARPENAIRHPHADDKWIADRLLGTRLPSQSGGPFAYVDLI